jgi:hypothetical protein
VSKLAVERLGDVGVAGATRFVAQLALSGLVPRYSNAPFEWLLPLPLPLLRVMGLACPADTSARNTTGKIATFKVVLTFPP